jgi:16S rRNA (cytidine1402-2'-O)-methyltransferase
MAATGQFSFHNFITRNGRPMSESTLYVVATPIGNLEDISPRALRILQEVDIIAAEDTRRTLQLLRHFGIDSPVRALHEHNERSAVPGLVDRMEAGDSVALVSDAGTPLISDPGFRLVREAAARELAVVAVPGPSALIAALSVSGLPTDRFVFEGFPPSRSAARLSFLESLAGEPRTLVFYESSHRIIDLLSGLQKVFGPDRDLAVCRELTKKFESVYRGTAGDVLAVLEAHADHRRGEFVVVVSGCRDTVPELAEALRLARLLLKHLPASQAARVAGACTGVPRRQIYQALGADGEKST